MTVSRCFNGAAQLSRRALDIVFNPVSTTGMGAAVGIASYIKMSAMIPPGDSPGDFWFTVGVMALFSSAAAAIVTGGLRAVEHGLDHYSYAHINRLSDWLNGKPPFGENAARRRDEFIKHIGELPKNFIP